MKISTYFQITTMQKLIDHLAFQNFEVMSLGLRGQVFFSQFEYGSLTSPGSFLPIGLLDNIY